MNEQLKLYEEPQPYVPVYLRPNIKQLMHEALAKQVIREEIASE